MAKDSFRTKAGELHALLILRLGVIVKKKKKKKDGGCFVIQWR